MTISLEVDEKVLHHALRNAEARGATVDQLMQNFLSELAGVSDPEADAAEFVRLSSLTHGDRRGWKFNREELHER